MSIKTYYFGDLNFDYGKIGIDVITNENGTNTKDDKTNINIFVNIRVNIQPKEQSKEQSKEEQYYYRFYRYNPGIGICSPQFISVSPQNYGIGVGIADKTYGVGIGGRNFSINPYSYNM